MARYTSGELTLDIVLRDDWGSGFVTDLTVTNGGGTALDGWTVAFDLDHEITNLWNAEIVSHEGSRYVIRSLSHNGDVGPGESVGFGFQASADPATPRDFTSVAIDDADADPGDPGDGDPGNGDPGDGDGDDVVPALSVSDVTVSEGDPAQAIAGYLHTEGNQILDSAGNAVRLTGVNWFGIESETHAPHGLWTRGYKDMMSEMKDQGFNVIRLPFSNEALDPGKVPNGIDFSQNPDLAGLSTIEIVDKIVDYAGEIGLGIILDNHRNDTGAGASGNGLWYNEEYPESRWVDDWVMLAERYADNPTVLGADLSNEPFNGTWGTGDPATDWAMAAEKAGNAILEANPDWLILVEGIASYEGEPYWWGGNLRGVADHPITLDVPGRLVYAPHAYPNSIHQQPWFSDPDYPDNLAEVFRENWGYVHEQGIAPVLVGEFGSRFEDPKDVQWMEAFLDYTEQADGPPISWTYWSWNPNSTDTGGILADDWRTVHDFKVEALEPHMGGEIGGEGETGTVTARSVVFEVTLDQPADAPVEVDYATQDGTAVAGEDYEAASGTLVFEAGETTKRVTVTAYRDTDAEEDESFALVLSEPRGATLDDDTGTALILDDDAPGDGDPGDGDPGDGDPGDGGGDGGDDPGSDDDSPATFHLTNQWNSGFTAEIEIVNDTGAALDGWRLTADLPFEIVNIWNAQIVSQDGDSFEIGDAGWNARLGADEALRFGFQGAFDEPVDLNALTLSGADLFGA